MDDFAISRAEQKLALIKGRSCDKYDYLISVACGAAAGQYIAVPTSASDAGAKANPHD